MARTDNLTNYLTDVATAIKTKKGDNTPIKASNFDTEIVNLPTGSGGVDISEYMGNYTFTQGDNATSGGFWIYLIKKLPPITSLNSNSAYFFNNFRGKEIDLSQVPADINFINTAAMFQNTDLNEIDLSHLNFDNVTNANSMFQASGTSLKKLGNNTFPKCKNFRNMFYNCDNETLPIENFNYSSATNLNGFLYGVKNFEADIEINAPLCTDFGNCLYNCKKITSAKISANEAVNMSGICYGCTVLKTLDLSGVNFIKMTGSSNSNSLNNFVKSCTSLENLTFGTNLGEGFKTTLSANNTYAKIDLSTCTSLTKASVLDIFNKVADISSKNTQQILLHADVKAQLTEEEIATVTSKNWSVS